MKKFYLFILFALLASTASVFAAEATITSTFTDKDLTVGDGELGWTASIVANGFETDNPSRGVQFGSAKGKFTLTSNDVITNFKSIKLVMSTNGTANANTMAIDIVDGTNITSILASTGIAKGNNQELTYSYTGAEAVSGNIVISINDKNKSVYFKSIEVTYEYAATELTAPTIQGFTDGATSYEDVTVSITMPYLATSIAYNIKKDGVTVASAEAATEAFSQTFSEAGVYTVSASATDGTNTKAATDATFTIKTFPWTKMNPAAPEDGTYMIVYGNPTNGYLVMKNEVYKNYYVTAEAIDILADDVVIPVENKFFVEAINAERTQFVIKNNTAIDAEATNPFVSLVTTGTYTNLKPAEADQFIWTFAGTEDAVEATDGVSNKYLICNTQYTEFAADVVGSNKYYPMFLKVSDNVSSVKAVSTTTAKAYGAIGEIRIVGGNIASIYNAAGQALVINTTDKSLSAPRGIYVVVVDGKAHKVVVK